MSKKSAPTFDRTVYLFHGGGALGAYQTGIFKALSAKKYPVDWVIGTSIGSVTSAIIAGNPPNERIKKLEELWDIVATKIPPVPNTLNNLFMERWQHFLSASNTACFGQPGFFMPRPVNPWLSIQSTADKLSYYDTSELRKTLLKLIDFDLINKKEVRLSMGAVHIATGRLVYFDNTKMPITIDHVMASCALPPGFPAVMVDDQFYWDGGVHSNTQLNLLLCEHEPITYLCFMVNLFNSYGTKPTNMDDVYKRAKDIEYSSHHRQAIYFYRNVHNLRHAIHTLCKNLSKEKQNDPELKELIALGDDAVIHAVRFHCDSKLSDLSSKDYEFSLPSIQQHIQSGCDDVARALSDPPWLKPYPEDLGLFLYEFPDYPNETMTPFEERARYHLVTE